MEVNENATTNGTVYIVGQCTDIPGATAVGAHSRVFCKLANNAMAAHITAAVLSISGNATVGGNAAVTGTLGVTGNTTLGGTLGVTGAATLSSTLVVAGVTSSARVKDATGDCVRVAALAGADTLTASSAEYQLLDPGGAHRDVTLPAALKGLTFTIKNTADAAENLVIKNAAAATIDTLGQNELGIFVCDGTNWRTLGQITWA
jgi:hypothetical protein